MSNRHYSYIDPAVGIGSQMLADQDANGGQYGVRNSVDIVARNITATGNFIGELTSSDNTFVDLNVTGIATIGIVTGATYYGDGSNLTGINTFSGNYNDLSNTPTIPSSTSDLTNDSGYITGTDNTTGTSGGLTGSPSITVTDITAVGNVSIAGTLTYEDVTNIDSIGIVTARTGIEVLNSGGVQVATGATINGETNIITALTNGSERLRITSDGKVGIGTTSVSTKLHLKSTGAIATRIESTGTSGDTILNLKGNANNWELTAANSSSVYGFFIKDVTNNRIPLFIDSSGNVLFGTTTNYADGGADNLVVGSTSVGEQGITIGASTSSQIRFADASANTAGYILYNHSDDALAFGVSSERMRIDSSGRLLVGTSSSNANADVDDLQIGNNDSATKTGITLGSTDQSGIAFADAGDARAGLIEYTHSIDALRFYTNGATNERMRIDSSGLTFFKGGSLFVQDSSTGFTSGDGLALITDGNQDKYVWNYENTSLRFGTNNQERMRIDSSGQVNVFADSTVHISRSGTGAGSVQWLYAGAHSATNTSNGTISFQVYTNGNVQNTNDSYGQISDIKLKENIVDAGSQWEDFKAVRFRKYNFKEETGHETHTQLGVIAQELELTSPGLVYETADKDEDGNDLGTTTKAVKSSILTKKALVALQEAMARIEQLEARISKLEGN